MARTRFTGADLAASRTKSPRAQASLYAFDAEEMNERLYFAWYLLPAAEVERRTRGVIAHTGWTRAERVEMSRQWTLQGFGSPSELGADEFPAGNPGAVLWVAAERYSEHLHEYAQAGWLLADDTLAQRVRPLAGAKRALCDREPENGVSGRSRGTTRPPS